MVTGVATMMTVRDPAHASPQRALGTALGVTCRIGDSAPVTLGFIVEDYVTHMRHHLQQIDELKAAR